MKEIIVSSVDEYIKHIETNHIPNAWFRGVSSSKFLPQPGLVWKKLRAIENSLEHDFLISYKAYINNDNLNKWEIYALMQHYGLPTRLLDWTQSALVGLYFALTTNPESDKNRVVWVLDPYELNKRTVDREALYCPSVMQDRNISEDMNIDKYLPPNLSDTGSKKLPKKPIAINTSKVLKRVSAQKGCFTLHGLNDDSIDKYLDDPEHFYMITISIKSDVKRKNMINTLAILGIDEEFIYQDLSSLCDRINRTRGV